MDSPCITLHTEAKSGFCYSDGYDGVSDSDVEVLFRLCREAAASLEGELMKRRLKRIPDQPGDLGKCCQSLHDTSRKVIIRGRLDGRALKQVNDAVEILKTSQATLPAKVYREFLQDVIRQCSPDLALLCAASFGRKRLLDLGANGRVDLLAYVKNARHSLDSPALETLTSGYQMPASNSPQLADIRAQSRSADATVDTSDTVEQPSSTEGVRQYQGDGHTTGPLAGRVYNLSVEDIQTVATSDQIRGQIWLTNPYTRNSSPFITVPISRGLSNELATIRVRVM
ncbi:MAG: hypothetical protein M4579_006739 [Chaenotheca gracillima]|nr:MAG: hypothetical protein M4579_006739 [Chaenotheca gracillima]